MATRDDRDLRKETRARRTKFIGAVAAIVLGALMAGIGFAIGSARTGDEATGWGVLAGIGFGLMLGGAVLTYILRPGATGWRTEPEPLKRDRLQAQRVRQLWIFPVVTLGLLVVSTIDMQDILTGSGSFRDFIGVSLPVLYAWIIALITLGWDHQSRANRRLMEDELTTVLRARAIGAAFVVLMAGASLAFGLGLWRADVAVMSLPFVLSAAGATAGIRFAWLDREYGKDG